MTAIKRLPGTTAVGVGYATFGDYAGVRIERIKKPFLLPIQKSIEIYVLGPIKRRLQLRAERALSRTADTVNCDHACSHSNAAAECREQLMHVGDYDLIRPQSQLFSVRVAARLGSNPPT